MDKRLELTELLNAIAFGFEKFTEDFENEDDVWDPWNAMAEYIEDNF